MALPSSVASATLRSIRTASPCLRVRRRARPPRPPAVFGVSSDAVAATGTTVYGDGLAASPRWSVRAPAPWLHLLRVTSVSLSGAAGPAAATTPATALRDGDGVGGSDDGGGGSDDGRTGEGLSGRPPLSATAPASAVSLPQAPCPVAAAAADGAEDPAVVSLARLLWSTDGVGAAARLDSLYGRLAPVAAAAAAAHVALGGRARGGDDGGGGGGSGGDNPAAAARAARQLAPLAADVAAVTAAAADVAAAVELGAAGGCGTGGAPLAEDERRLLAEETAAAAASLAARQLAVIARLLRLGPTAVSRLVAATIATQGSNAGALADALLESAAASTDGTSTPDADDGADADATVDTRVILELRAGAGGDEAALFVSELAEMYRRAAGRRGWVYTPLSASETDLGGVRETVARVTGRGVAAAFAAEAGVHRVQRVPATESGGRVHTSTATVAVLRDDASAGSGGGGRRPPPVPPAEVRVDVYRASGAGGQHVNKTSSAVRLTHLPTGLVVTCQDDRSQHRNRAMAMDALAARLAARAESAAAASRVGERRAQLGTTLGERSERIRTYNFPQRRVTDHRLGGGAGGGGGAADAVLDLPVGSKSAPLEGVLAGGEELDGLMERLARQREADDLRALVAAAAPLGGKTHHG
ncbi:hypothetical protein MMPV_003967 [Pyropia vietnamensis]